MARKILNILEDIYKEGYSTAELKKGIIKILEPYFENKQNLKDFAFDAEILSSFEFIIRYHHDKEFAAGLQEVLCCYRAAYRAYPNEVMNMFLDTLSIAIQKENLMSSISADINIIKDENKDLHDRVFYSMRLIGDNLEIGTKYIITEIDALIKLLEGDMDYTAIKKDSFGVTIQRILDNGKLQDILLTKPIEIKLSDWRNIAYHHSYKVFNNEICCSYGKGNKQFSISFIDLVQYTYQIVRAANIFNIARCIFIFDIFYDFSRNHNKSYKKYDDMKFYNKRSRFEISLLSQKFRLKNIIVEEDSIEAIIDDMTNDRLELNNDKRERLMHLSQFLFYLWTIENKDNIKMVYQNNYGKAIAGLTIKGEFFSNENCKRQDMAHNVDFVIYPK